MKLSNVLKSGAVAVAAGTLALGGASAANAATSIPSGHVDAVEVVCDASGEFEVSTHTALEGEIAPGNIGAYEFDYAPGTGVVFNSGTWDVVSAPTTGPSVGFNYERVGSTCPDSISIVAEDSGASDGDARFTPTVSGIGGLNTASSSSLTLGTANPHVHGSWAFDGGTSSGGNWDLKFTVNGDPGLIVDPFQVRIS